MRNPLRKRLLRELFGDIGKYLVIFLMLVLSIGFVSGFLVAGGSMAQAYFDSFEKYNIEDGNFRTTEKLSNSLKESIEKNGIKIYDLFYVEQKLNNDTKIRIFANREDVNKACVMKGKLPEKTGEIAIDRMYADNNRLKIGDIIQSENNSYKITGLVALSDYSALFYSNNDMMFDALAFGISLVSKNQFEKYDESQLHFNYAFKYNVAPLNEDDEKEKSDELMEVISQKTDLENFVPRYLNQAISFTGDDIVKDKAMMEVLLYIIIVIIAFVFGITISNTIQKEANVIGTLRASGYTQNELIRHYMTIPLIVTLIAAVFGNIIGYTYFKNLSAAMYYGSYSLPTYVTIWNMEAFLKTTITPLVLMMIITFVILKRKLSLSPLKLLRKDLSGGNQKYAVKLSHNIRFLDRFRMRVLIQNKGSYITLFIGLFFANFLLFFGMMLPPLMTHFQETVTDSMLAKYTYLIQIPISAVDKDDEISSMFSMLFLQSKIETNNPDAEKFSAHTLKTIGQNGSRIEEITLYGITDKSKYVDAEFNDKTVLISSAYADKFELKAGDIITLKEPYEDNYYGFKVTGIYPYDGSVCVFMSQKHLNDVFGYDEDFFAGYFSDSEITDIEDKYLGTIIDEEALTRVSRQLTISMGNLMYMVDGFSVIFFVVLIYLLSKLVIERNAQSISMVKILGYSRNEIAKLYIVPTAIVVVISLLITYPMITCLMVRIFRIMLKEMMSGWLIIWLDPKVYYKMFLLGIVSYALVAVLEYFKISRIPMEEALKNIE